MIASKLQRDIRKQNILIQFSNQSDIPEVISLFIDNLRSQRISIKRSKIVPHQVNYYIVTERKQAKYGNIQMNDIPSQFMHMLTVLYLNDQTQTLISLSQNPKTKTLLLRQDLKYFYSLQYEVEETVSKQQSLMYLCNICASYLNSYCSKGLNYYDKKNQSLSKVREDSFNSPQQLLWANILYQIPGVGQEKATQIAKAFPTYQSIAKDPYSLQKLKKLEIQGKGGKKIKVGPQIGARIHKIMTNKKHNESVI